MVDLKQLHYAVTLAKHRNFARAAAALDMSQPALSRSISGLEAELGVQLFTRGARGAEPTPFGERFLLRAALLLREAGELEREVRLIQGAETGSLRVGAGPYPAGATRACRSISASTTGVRWSTGFCSRGWTSRSSS